MISLRRLGPGDAARAEAAVAEPWRRRGLGTSLLDEIRRLARAEGMFEAFVLTSRGNAAARGLYARTGAVVEDDGFGVSG